MNDQCRWSTIIIVQVYQNKFLDSIDEYFETLKHLLAFVLTKYS